MPVMLNGAERSGESRYLFIGVNLGDLFLRFGIPFGRDATSRACFAALRMTEILANAEELVEAELLERPCADDS
jgi:hypothetical protein